MGHDITDLDVGSRQLFLWKSIHVENKTQMQILTVWENKFLDIYVCSVFFRLIQVGQRGLDIWNRLKEKECISITVELLSLLHISSLRWNMETTVLCFLLKSFLLQLERLKLFNFCSFRYAWTISICATCETQLGWLFTATNRNLKPKSFWGIRCSQLADATRWYVHFG